MLNKQQIKLVQTAVRSAGLRGKGSDGRYYLLLGQYIQTNGKSVTSCKQLNNWQLDDILAICESFGWRCPGRSAAFYRDRISRHGKYDQASFAQQAAIKHLAGDLGWNDHNLAGMLERMTKGQSSSIATLSPRQAYVMIEALKNMLGRNTGKKYTTLKQVQKDTEVSDGTEKGRKTHQVG